MRSYRIERMKQLEEGMRARHEMAGRMVVERFIKPETPVGTPATTGDPDYKVTSALRQSISHRATSDHVDMGTNKKYGPYVHQGTYDFAHGSRGWEEVEAREAEAMFRHNSREESGRKGAMPRPYLVTGLLKAKVFLKAIYGKPIN